MFSDKLWVFRRFTSQCAGGFLKNLSGTMSDKKDYITDSCIRLMRQLGDVYDSDKVSVHTYVVLVYSFLLSVSKILYSQLPILTDKGQGKNCFCFTLWSSGV